MNETIKKIKENYLLLESSIVNQLFLEFSHSPTTGSYREDVWRNLFKQIIPKKFSIENGVFIIDSKGEISKEVDLAIFDEQYTPYIFNYGNMKFIPIEAVAVAIQCKSHSIDNKILKAWSDSIKILKTSNESIARMYGGLTRGDSFQINNPLSQTATRPLLVLCHLKDSQKNNSSKPNKDNFDIILCANNGREENGESNKIEVSFSKAENLNYWYETLNHNNPELKSYVKKGDINDEINLENYRIDNNPILSLIFQLNQVLMLINNPMLFPHKAYVEMFRALPETDEIKSEDLNK